MKKALFALIIVAVVMGMAGTAQAVSYKVKSVREIMKASQTVKANNVSIVKKATEVKDPCKNLKQMQGNWKDTLGLGYTLTATVTPSGSTCKVKKDGNKQGITYSVVYEGTEMPLVNGEGMDKTSIYMEGVYLINKLVNVTEKYKKIN